MQFQRASNAATVPYLIAVARFASMIPFISDIQMACILGAVMMASSKMRSVWHR